MFEKICIIGCGLIGSSLARSIKKNKLSKNLVASNRSDETNKKVLELNIVDDSNSDIKKMVKDSDLIIVATPLSSYENVIVRIKDCFKKNAILTDVGSVKNSVMNLFEKHVSDSISWISSHPIAGTEESGPEAGFADLFKNKWCILTPSKKSKKEDLEKLKNFWEKVGSKIDVMDAEKHDYILSITSHIPHLVAYNIVNTSLEIENSNKLDIIKYSAGGLRDFTRIAASNPIMWRDIFLHNQKNTIETIDKFIKNLEDLKKAIKNKDGEKLKEIFTKTQKIRKQIVEAGQDTTKPDFGRN